MAIKSSIRYFVTCVFLTSNLSTVHAQDVWQNQKSNVDASLRGLCVVDQNIAWASGSEGTVLRTSDAGKTWNNVSIGKAKELDFRDIHAFNDKHAVVISAGQPARVYRTTDAGDSWKMTFEHPNEKSFFDALSFWDSKHGIAMSDPIDGHVLLIETKDGGATWVEKPKTERPKIMRGEAGFAASGTNMIVFGDTCLVALGSAEKDQQEKSSRIIVSHDRGMTWTVSKAPINRKQSSGIFSMAFANSKFGVLVGGDYLKPELNDSNFAFTKDGGKNWYKTNGTPPREYRSCVAFVKSGDTKHIVAVGPSGTDYSSDAGQSWQAASETGFHSIAFTDDGKAGWASGSDGRIAKWNGFPSEGDSK